MLNLKKSLTHKYNLNYKKKKNVNIWDKKSLLGR